MNTIDLLPREIKERAQRRRRFLLLTAVGCLLLAGLVLARVELSHQVQAWEQRMAQVEAERARLSRLAEMRAEITRLEKLLSQETTPPATVPPWGELMWFLARVTPPQVVLRELRWDGNVLRLAGEASDLAGTAALVRALEECPYLSQVSAAEVTRTPEKGPVLFTITAAWRTGP